MAKKNYKDDVDGNNNILTMINFREEGRYSIHWKTEQSLNLNYSMHGHTSNTPHPHSAKTLYTILCPK